MRPTPTPPTLRLRLAHGALIAGVGVVGTLATAPLASGSGGGEPEVLYLTGTVRDFHERSHPDGHPDFEKRPAAGFGHFCGNISPQLGEDGKPVYTGGGFKVASDWRDSEGRPICYAIADEEAGDSMGSQGVADDGAIDSSASFSSWYNDVPGTNMSAPLTLRLVKTADDSYVFDDKLDPQYSGLGGFFPIEDDLFGNPGGSPDRNFHFTFELHTEFTYDASLDQTFKFIGDDDVWVFIDGKMVIDLGGVHGAKEQFVSLDRLGLEDGETYALDFFFAERHRTQSNFRIQTNLALVSPVIPTITAAFD